MPTLKSGAIHQIINASFLFATLFIAEIRIGYRCHLVFNQTGKILDGVFVDFVHVSNRIEGRDGAHKRVTHACTPRETGTRLLWNRLVQLLQGIQA